jgi:hypothetical protein
MRQSIVVLRGAHAALPWLAATRSPTINLGSLYTTEEYARILVGTGVDLVVVPDPEFMYSTTSWPFSAVIDSTSGFTPSTPRRPIVLNYPLSDADRLLLHPVFAHELGHASADEHGLVRAVEDELDHESGFITAFEVAVDEMADNYWPAATRAQISGTIRSWLRAWIEELLCDHLAIEAAGPSFIWAFAAFVMPLTYGEPGSEHPPNTVRMCLALDHLTRRGWRPYMERVAPGVTSWLDGIALDSADPLEPPFGFLRDQLLTHSRVLQDAVMAVAGADALDHGTCEGAADEAARLLDHLILPVGLATPIEPRAILLGGWQHIFGNGHDSPSGVVEALTDTRTQELLGKAIELSIVATGWESTR